MHRAVILLSMFVLIPVAGCTALTASGPMPERLDPEEQATVDSSWNNAFASPYRVDRTLLLDVLRSYQLYWHGVDRLNATIEKRLAHGRVVMNLHYDRQLADNENDFIVTFYDKRGTLVRRERYARADIDERDWLYEIRLPQDLSPEKRDAESKALQVRREARMAEVIAATQPAE